MRDPAATKIVPKVKTHADPAAGLLATVQPGVPAVSHPAVPATPSTGVDRPGNPGDRVAQGVHAATTTAPAGIAHGATPQLPTARGPGRTVRTRVRAVTTGPTAGPRTETVPAQTAQPVIDRMPIVPVVMMTGRMGTDRVVMVIGRMGTDRVVMVIGRMRIVPVVMVIGRMRIVPVVMVIGRTGIVRVVTVIEPLLTGHGTRATERAQGDRRPIGRDVRMSGVPTPIVRGVRASVLTATPARTARAAKDGRRTPSVRDETKIARMRIARRGKGTVPTGTGPVLTGPAPIGRTARDPARLAIVPTGIARATRTSVRPTGIGLEPIGTDRPTARTVTGLTETDRRPLRLGHSTGSPRSARSGRVATTARRDRTSGPLTVTAPGATGRTTVQFAAMRDGSRASAGPSVTIGLSDRAPSAGT